MGEGGALRTFILRMCLRLLDSEIVSDLKSPLPKGAYVSFASLECVECYIKCCRSVRLLSIYPSLIRLSLNDRICDSKDVKLENTRIRVLLEILQNTQIE